MQVLRFLPSKVHSCLWKQHDKSHALSTEEKRKQELASLNKISDGFRRIVIAGTMQPTCMNDDGILFVNIIDFLKNPLKYVDEA